MWKVKSVSGDPSVQPRNFLGGVCKVLSLLLTVREKKRVVPGGGDACL